MTDIEINKVIAALLGTPYHKPTEEALKSGCYYQYEPDFCHDLNAMHKAEKTLNPGLSYNYAEKLAEVLGIELHIACFQDIYDMLVATPRQRAEAFLKTLNKWKE